MTRMRHQMIACVCISTLAAAGIAQPPTSMPGALEPASTEPAIDIEQGMRLLSGVRDNVFSFDDPAFYWFCRFVRADADTGRYTPHDGSASQPLRFLIERPGDYRGRLVRIDGRLLRLSAFDVPNRPGVGRLYQCEIGDRGSRAICTAIVTTDPGAIRIGTPVTVCGYFIKVRSYTTTSGEAGAGPLLVSKQLTVSPIPEGSRASAQNAAAYLTWFGIATAVLMVAWMVVRRFAQQATSSTASPGFSLSTSASPADFDWLTPERHESTESRREP